MYQIREERGKAWKEWMRSVVTTLADQRPSSPLQKISPCSMLDSRNLMSHASNDLLYAKIGSYFILIYIWGIQTCSNMFDQIYVLKFKGFAIGGKMNRHGTYVPYLLFMHKLQLLLPHSYHTSNDLAIRPQGVYWRGGGQRQQKYCSPFLLFSNYFSGSSEDAQRLMKDQ